MKKVSPGMIAKRIGGALCALVLCALAIAAPALYGRMARGGGKFNGEEYQGILTLYAVDTFEGGVGSRSDFLFARAGEFEKKHKGVLISVEGHTPESLAERFSQGKIPDMISFGAGAGEIERWAQPLGREFSGGAFAGKTYAVPWCKGAYCLIGRGEIAENPSRVIASKGATNQPLLALLESGVSPGRVEEREPLAAYTEFLSAKEGVLLGTQRDVHRLERRGVEVTVRPLPAFCDLYQYFAVTSQSRLASVYAEAFLDFLLSEESQKKLSRIGMLPAERVRVYEEEGHMRALEDADGAPSRTLSAFSSAAALSSLAENCRRALAGDAVARQTAEALLIKRG